MTRRLIAIIFLLTILVSCNKDEKDNAPIETFTINTEDGTVIENPVKPAPAPAPSPAPSPAPTVSSNAGKISLWLSPTTYDSAVFLPADYGADPNRVYPFILSLHGLNGSVLNTSHTAVGGAKTGFIKQLWGTTLAKSYPAIVVAPNWAPAGSTASGLWNSAKLRQLILAAAKKYKVDADRIVVTGLSAGSIATQELMKNSKDIIAAAMPGAYNSTLIASNPCHVADMPVWAFGNTSDALFVSTGWNSLETKVQNCSNYIHEFRLSVYQNTCGHGCWDSHWAKPEVQEWLINQSK